MMDFTDICRETMYRMKPKQPEMAAKGISDKMEVTKEDKRDEGH